MPLAHAAPKDIQSEKIDIVYLWVDGNDPVWRHKRQAALQRLSANSHNSIAKYGNVEGRFRDNDELRYSLRALERYFPDCGHVYIVTDAQTPAWLRHSANTSSHISVIDHKDLIPASKLPTFDSANIESYIHRIPNLSEQYFYLNDDVFFGSPVDLSDWFIQDGTQNRICVGWSDDLPVSNQGLQPDATALENACRLSIQWLKSQETTYPNADLIPFKHTYRTFAHAPRPMLKSMLIALETEAADLFESVRSTVFRAWDKPTIVSDFVLRWALANGQATLRDYAHVYLSTGDVQNAAQLNSLVAADGLLDFFCINDTTDDADNLDPRLAVVQAALQTMFPIASRYES
jgi:Stealth protein CR2, conserved region 2/Stealth protein CR1, conserved region 1/Stealth protein CR4, conserved region 4